MLTGTDQTCPRPAVYPQYRQGHSHSEARKGRGRGVVVARVVNKSMRNWNKNAVCPTCPTYRLGARPLSELVLAV
jgi:hypothetical protein